MKTKRTIFLGVIFIGVVILLAGCSDKKDEVNIFPIEDPSGISWCKYKVTKMNSTDSTDRLQTGKIICIKCPNPNKNCPDYKRFKYGAFDMNVKRVMKPCTSCPNQNYFDVGGAL